jgi:hypothetical protein
MLPPLTMNDMMNALWHLTTPTLDLMLLMHEMDMYLPKSVAPSNVSHLREILGFDSQTIRKYLEIRANFPEELITATIAQLHKAVVAQITADISQMCQEQQQNTSRRHHSGGGRPRSSKPPRRRPRRRP